MERGFVAGGGSGDGFPHPSSRGAGSSGEQRRWGRGFPHPSSWGQVLRGGTGMGPRIREDNGWGRGRKDGGLGGVAGGGWDGFPHTRKKRRGVGEEGWWTGWRCGWGVGWVPASVFAGTTGRGAEMTGGAGGPQEQRMEGWIPASARTRERGGFPHSSRGELSVGGHGRVHPHPNLPP